MSWTGMFSFSEKCVPAQSSGIGTKFSLWSLPTQAVLWSQHYELTRPNMLLISFFFPPNSFFFVKQVWNSHISVCMSFSTLFWHLGYFPFTSLVFPIYFNLLTVEVAGSCWVQGRWCVALFLLAQGTFNSDSVWGFAERTVVHRKGYCFS